jgi:opacity protein-like surface antigen
MKMIRSLLGLVTVCALVAGPAFAADVVKPEIGQLSQGPQRSSQIVGATVKNPQGENLGKIDELVIGRDGMVSYAILSHGGVLGIGDKLVPIPWKALKYGPKEGIVMVNVDKVTLEKAPNFDPKEWPNFTEPAWQKRVETYYTLPAK